MRFSAAQFTAIHHNSPWFMISRVSMILSFEGYLRIYGPLATLCKTQVFAERLQQNCSRPLSGTSPT